MYIRATVGTSLKQHKQATKTLTIQTHSDRSKPHCFRRKSGNATAKEMHANACAVSTLYYHSSFALCSGSDASP